MGWTKLIGVAGVDSKANSVAVDGSGNIYVTGRTKGNLDGQTMTGTEDAFLIKYDSSGETLNFRREKPHVSGRGRRFLPSPTPPIAGTRQWSKLKGGAGNYARGQSVAVDSSGNRIAMVGYTKGRRLCARDPKASYQCWPSGHALIATV